MAATPKRTDIFERPLQLPAHLREAARAELGAEFGGSLYGSDDEKKKKNGEKKAEATASAAEEKTTTATSTSSSTAATTAPENLVKVMIVQPTRSRWRPSCEGSMSSEDK